MTRKVFWEDPYRTELDTVVSSVSGNDVTVDHRVEVSFDREVSSDALAALEPVLTTAREGDKWQLAVEDTDAAVQALSVFARQQGTAIVTLNTLAPSLDEAFLRFTGEAEP